MLKIIFSYGYDCHKVIDRSSTTGEVTLGPLGLLSLLETQLGLAKLDASFTTRLIQYHQCIKQNINSRHFFSRSFSENEFASARTLLEWRDNLYMGGWNGQFVSEVSNRLRDLADIESIAHDKVALNTGQRIQKIINTLTTDQVQIAEITLNDDVQLLPPLYCRLFDILSDQCTITEANVNHKPIAASGSDLYNLQMALTKPKKGKVTLKKDDSFTVIKAGSKSVSSALIANLISKAYSKKSKNSYGILCEHEGEHLYSALDRLGASRQANNENTPWRPAFQVLPLCFEIMWSPLNPYTLLEFLTHPIGPIPKAMRSALASCVANQPGIGSDTWNKTIEDQLSSLAEHNLDLAERSEKALEKWIPQKLICPNEGMPCEDALQRAQMLNDWFTGKLVAANDSPEHLVYVEALKQVREFIHALTDLKQSGITRLSRESIRQLITQVLGRGMSLVDKVGDTNLNLPDIQFANSPSGFCSNQDVVVWWSCEGYHTPQKAPWSKAELDDLNHESVQLWSNTNRLQLLAKQWIKPIFSARKQLIIVLHPEYAQHHPIMDNIAGVSANWPIIDCEQNLLSTTSFKFGGVKTSTKSISRAVDQLDLDTPSRWWQLPAKAKLPKREIESFSSLDQFINSPYQWVLNYQAQLRTSRTSKINDDNRLKGNLAHRLFEDYFNEHAEITITPAKLRKWTSKKLDNLIETEGAVLLMPGRQSESIAFREQASYALSRLIKHLVEANVVSVTMEAAQEGSFPIGKIGGYIDLLAKNNKGDEVVLDIKWGGSKHRRQTIADDNYLQLATYAALRKRQTGKWPALAYFIISDASLISNDENYFASAIIVKPKSDESTAEYWQRFIATWKWRREQINKELIEVTISATEQTEESLPNEKCLSIPESSDKYNDFYVLTGLGK